MPSRIRWDSPPDAKGFSMLRWTIGLAAALAIGTAGGAQAQSVLSRRCAPATAWSRRWCIPTRRRRRRRSSTRCSRRTGQAAEHRLARRGRHGLRRPGCLWRRRGGRGGDAEHGPAGGGGAEAHLGLFAGDLHADPLGDPDRPAAGQHRADAADPGWGHDHEEPLGGRDFAAGAARRGGLCDGAVGQVARRRRRGDAAAGHRLRRVLRLSTRRRRRSARASTSAAIPTWC